MKKLTRKQVKSIIAWMPEIMYYNWYEPHLPEYSLTSQVAFCVIIDKLTTEGAYPQILGDTVRIDDGYKYYYGDGDDNAEALLDALIKYLEGNA